MALGFQRWGFHLQANKRVQSIELSLAPTSTIWDAGAYPEWDVRNSPTTYGGVPFHVSQGGMP